MKIIGPVPATWRILIRGGIFKFYLLVGLGIASAMGSLAALHPLELRTEWLVNPEGIDAQRPRLSWRVESEGRGRRQTAYRILVASREQMLKEERGDVWDSGKVSSDETIHRVYNGPALKSGQRCYWKVKVWDQADQVSAWSQTARWSMGLLEPADWKGQWISFRDESPLHTSRQTLYLPPARHYRKTFEAGKAIRRATIYASALGLYELHLNGQRIGDAFFEPGWADYAQRAHYRAHDVTDLLKPGANAVGAILAEGWYSGYVGYGVLVGYGPNQSGRYFYGKTPAWLAQLEIEYADGSRQTIATDPTWQVSGDGPIREADLIMGESFDARSDQKDWCRPGGAGAWSWQPAIRAEENGNPKAIFSDNQGDRQVELGFRPPLRLQFYAAPPIRVTQELKTRRLTEPKEKIYVFDLGQNFAGTIRLKVKGPAGARVQLRYGEMLHQDGRLMTENLRRARATDFYILRGDPEGETWIPRFTYHGFQYVEVTGLPDKPDPEAITGLVLHNDTPMAGRFECSDEVMNQFWKNTQWTQRANFVEVPTDCPQRDERLGWMGDAQAYIRTASFNADVAAFFTKWLDDVEEAQRGFGAYPDYCPYPMGHGAPGKTFGTAWTDAGIICPWTVWKVYGDTRLLERHWDSMTRFMQWRQASTSPEGLGVSIGNTWGDWLNVNEPTPIEYIDTCYHARVCRLMEEMALALGRPVEARNYARRFEATKSAFNLAYVNADGSLKVDTQTAYALAIAFRLLPDALLKKSAARLAEKIKAAGDRMTTGFLGTGQILPALSAAGYHELAVRLFQSRQFPSWGYEVINGANTVWERWDSYTREHGFEGRNGNQNASMNSFSHYAFGSVMEWAFRELAGIDTADAGYKHILLKPNIPVGTDQSQVPVIHWVKAEYASVRGPIEVAWKRSEGKTRVNVRIPANTAATLLLPTRTLGHITEGGSPLSEVNGVKRAGIEGDRAVLQLESGRYEFGF